DWSSDVCSSDLRRDAGAGDPRAHRRGDRHRGSPGPAGRRPPPRGRDRGVDGPRGTSRADAAAVPFRAQRRGDRRRRALRRVRQPAAVLRDAARAGPGARPVDLRGADVSGAAFPGLWPVLLAVFAAAAAALALAALVGRQLATRHRARFEQAVGAQMRESFLFVDISRLFVLQHLLAASATIAAWLLT